MWSLRAANRQAEEAERAARMLALTARLQRLVAELPMPAHDYLIMRDAGERDNFARLWQSTEEALGAVESLPWGTQEAAMLEDLRGRLGHVKRRSEEILAGPIDPDKADKMGELMEEMDAHAVEAANLADSLVVNAGSLASGALAGAERAGEAGLIAVLLAGLAAAAVAAFVAFVTYGRMMRPLEVLAGVSERIAAGDLSGEVNVEAGGELGSVAQNFARMTTLLRGLIGGIKVTAGEVASTADSFLAAVTTMASSSEQVATAAEEMAGAATEQAQQVEQVHSAVEEVRHAAEEMAALARDGKDSSERTARLARKGGEAAAAAVAGMSRMTEAVERVVSVMRELGHGSQEIDKVIGVITGIADQTKLLALNAAIEAARVGEMGRGFAVVAQEVRELAEGSERAAGQVSGIVATVRAQVGEAVTASGDAMREVKAGEERIAEVRSSLEDILEAAYKTAGVAGAIEASAAQQLAALREAAGATESLAAAAEETSASSEEVAASIGDVSRASEQTAVKAQELARIATRLFELSGRFRTGEDDVVVKKQRDLAGERPPNCWEFKKCGREAGGPKAAELGVCPAYPDHGRRCAEVTGTLCGGKVQGTFAHKLGNCLKCDFYNSPYYDR